MPTPMERIASKAMGTAKKAKGTLEGLTGVFKTLMEEHGEVSALLLRLKASGDLETRSRLWSTIRRELLTHERGETAVVYAMYEEYPALAPLAAEHNDQADSLEKLIEEVDAVAISGPRWQTLYEQLMQRVQEHVHDEEKRIFPAGQAEFGGQTDALREEYLRQKDIFQSQV